ncbi:putative DEAD/DEAH box RNA helicase [Planoprotostelium fungivorum]|uniref:ATP-dependent RNA helicase n=1 Tax=Planoprotostelium fungivorum TaxID=1890364 RepID=A0A2P6MPD9_9EUKA|nr:putative DEAD/DEAH box RNA helicase [Planoprotostelium fungivorum]
MGGDDGELQLNLDVSSEKKSRADGGVSVLPKDLPNRKRKEPETTRKQKALIAKKVATAPLPGTQSLKKIEEETTHDDTKRDPSVFGDAITSFEDFKLNERLNHAIKEKLQLSNPTSIQRMGIGYLLKSERDAMIKAETGSGKTLTYLIPVLHKLHTLSLTQKIFREQGTYAVVLVPTRELCIQVLSTLTKLTSSTPFIIPGAVMGGEKKASEKARLRKGITVLVATPGRLLDHLNTTSSLRVDNLRYLVLDEADRLLDMGFERDVNTIVDIFRRQSQSRVKSGKGDHGFQSILISATLKEGIERLAGQNLRDPEFISTEKKEKKEKKKEGGEELKKEEEFAAPKQLQQYYVSVECKDRLTTLVSFVRWKSQKSTKMILFLSNTDSVDFLYAIMTQSRFPFVKSKKEEDNEEAPQALIPLKIHRLHGNLPQVDRTKVYVEFNEAKSGVMICSDVAARGMDFPGVEWIVQYDPPGETTEYIHRIGRTARLGKIGNALVFLLPSEIQYIEQLKRHKIAVVGIDANEIRSTLPMQKKIESQDVSHDLQLYYERMVMDDPELAGLARRGFTSFVRAYSTHSKEAKHIFHVKNLHLGHVAKSFALREQPKDVTSQQSRKAKAANREKTKSSKVQAAMSRRGNTMQTAHTSEFDAGF